MLPRPRHEAELVSARGELDVASAPLLSVQLDSAARRSKHVIVDLSEVTFLDARGVSMLVSSSSRITDGGGQLLLRNVPPRVGRVLRLSGVTHLLEH